MQTTFYRAFLFFSGLFLTINTVAQQPSLATLNIGDAAPPVKVSKWIKGQPVSAFQKGKVYVVEFWATWCLPCIAGMPHLSELADKYKKEVTISGISVWERSKTTLAMVENFVDSMGSKMNYDVAADDSSYMGNNWLKASGTNGIPAAFIIDKNGKIAWIGLPKKLDEVLPAVINGSWNSEKFGADRKERARLTKIDNNEVVNRLNPYMGNPGKSDSALILIDQILSIEPQLKYYPKVGNFTIWSLIKTNQEKALAFGKEWLASSDEPSYKVITDAVGYMADIRKVELIKGLYELAAYSYQAQIDNYPWSMNIPVTYDNIAQLQFRAGNKDKAIESENKAIEIGKATTNFPPDQLTKFEENLKKYKEAK